LAERREVVVAAGGKLLRQQRGALEEVVAAVAQAAAAVQVRLQQALSRDPMVLHRLAWIEGCLHKCQCISGEMGSRAGVV
jgi:hypothetical protein